MKLLFISAVIFGFTLTVGISENLYVTPAGAGASNGSDWSNAFAGCSDIVWGSGAGQLGAGDTLYMAGGVYTNASSFELKGSGSAGNILNIVRARATNSACSSATGWSSSYDDQVIINGGNWAVWAETGSTTAGGGRYTLMDGITNDGIRLNLFQNALSTGVRINAQGVFNTTFKNIGMYGPGTNAVVGGFTWLQEVRGIYVSGYSPSGTWTNGVSVYPSDITFEQCTIAGVVTAIASAYNQRINYISNDIHTVECLVGDPHGNILYASRTMDMTFSYNDVHDSMFAVGIFFTYLGDGGVRSSNIVINGNIFRDATQGADRAIEVRTESAGIGPLFIYNNTFVNLPGSININSALNTLAESYIANNLLISTANIGGDAFPDAHLTTNNNYFASSSGLTNFVSAGSTNILSAPRDWQYVRNLRLTNGAAPINLGANLGSTYQKDKDGNTFGVDGFWDIGSYEFQGGGGGGSSPTAAAQIVNGIPNSKSDF